MPQLLLVTSDYGNKVVSAGVHVLILGIGQN
jgi:hypothetical protein